MVPLGRRNAHILNMAGSWLQDQTKSPNKNTHDFRTQQHVARQLGMLGGVHDDPHMGMIPLGEPWNIATEGQDGEQQGSQDAEAVGTGVRHGLRLWDLMQFGSTGYSPAPQETLNSKGFMFHFRTLWVIR